MMMTKGKYFPDRQVFALLLLLALGAQVFGQSAASAFTPAERSITDAITAASIKGSTEALASPEMEGRGTLQPGGEKAAKWIADQFQKFGLKPLGDKGSYMQKVDLKETVLTPESSLTIGDETLTHGIDYAILPQNTGNKEASGEMVFIAYGIQLEKPVRNDLAGIDVRGKIAVMVEGPPANIPADIWKKQNAQMVFTKAVMMKGAAAVIYIGHGREGDPMAEPISYLSRRQVVTHDASPFPPGIPPIVYIGQAAAEKLFAKSDVKLKEALAQAESNSFKPFKLDQKAKINAKYKTVKGTSPNVVGYIEGSDPKLKEEAVVFSAHYDAYGTDNGKIYAGAADNALGTAELLAVAEAYSKLTEKPKRSMIFLAVTGEEYGLFGSKHWAKDPTWNIKKVAANLNLDGIGTEVYGPVKYIVGYGAEYSTLGAMLVSVANTLGIETMPDPVPEEGVFYRSDHYSFVERGIPSLMLLGAPGGEKAALLKRIKDWTKTDYHQPTDVIKPDWAWEGAETVAEVMGIMGWRISEAETMPAWLPDSRFVKYDRGNSKSIPREE